MAPSLARFVREHWGCMLTVACLLIVLALLAATSHDDALLAGIRYGSF